MLTNKVYFDLQLSRYIHESSIRFCSEHETITMNTI